jgi:hypothetical protein
LGPGALTTVRIPVPSAAEMEMLRLAPTPTDEIRTMAESLVDTAGRPLVTNELYQLLTGRGVVIYGQNPRGNLSAKLHGGDKLVNLKGGYGWWFKDRPYPPAQYDPNKAEAPSEDESLSASVNS